MPDTFRSTDKKRRYQVAKIRVFSAPCGLAITTKVRAIDAPPRVVRMIVGSVSYFTLLTWVDTCAIQKTKARQMCVIYTLVEFVKNASFIR